VPLGMKPKKNLIYQRESLEAGQKKKTSEKPGNLVGGVWGKQQPAPTKQLVGKKTGKKKDSNTNNERLRVSAWVGWAGTLMGVAGVEHPTATKKRVSRGRTHGPKIKTEEGGSKNPVRDL